MSKSRKSYSQLCKEIEALNKQQNVLAENAGNVLMSELISTEEKVRFLLADASTSELKRLAHRIAPVIVDCMSSNL